MKDQRANAHRIAFMGFGEAAQAFVSGWAMERPDRIDAYDVKTAVAGQQAVMQARYHAHGVAGRMDPAAALAGAEVIFSLVTADRALEAATSAVGKLSPAALWLDCNSCAPDTKREAARVIESAGGRYVDVAVMAPVHPKRHLVPILLSGPHAKAAETAMLALGMKPRIAGAAVGDASSIKMLRSVMIKGLEALCAECFLAARSAGVKEQVIASLEASNPEIDWRAMGAYNLGRMMVHGARRAAEMREVEKTVAGLSLSARMSAATALWQDEIASLGLDEGAEDLFDRADRLLAKM